ncbi:MAG: filamentation protein [Zetaproteobacteria bacterium CG1_02_53_45]|nr:MAG: filamentation protein [Zetaproteobacteria bacterium CG1_02_53_45]
MEPLMPADAQHRLENLAFDLVAKSQGLTSSLHTEVIRSISDLVRSMNCYYSNLIEGHNTHPASIEKALRDDYSSDPEIRDLQLEARAHIEVQRLIDEGKTPAPAFSAAFICWAHSEFCQRLPDELLRADNPDTGGSVQIEPGRFREGDVQVGRHVAVPADTLDSFTRRFEEGYALLPSRAGQIIAVAAAHHRMLWIHPFYDGNGRVVRLQSYARLRELGIGSSLWSVARGLARNVREYKLQLQAADMPRQGDLDGRGNLSMQGLESFCEFFLSACIDQVEFMRSILKPNELMRRIELYCRDEMDAGRLMKGSYNLLREALLAGSFERGRAPEITGYADRQARKVLKALLDRGLLVSDSPKGAVRLGFPEHVLEHWLPRLYPTG